jgi:hypothetical protein
VNVKRYQSINHLSTLYKRLCLPNTRLPSLPYSHLCLPDFIIPYIPNLSHLFSKSKSKAVSLQHAGAKGETTALDGGEWSATPPVPIGEDGEWASELVWTQRLQEKSSASAADQILVTRL